MPFNNEKERRKHLDSYGIKEGDEIVMICENELKGKLGEVVQVHAGFLGPLYNIKFHDGTGTIKNNKFARNHIELA